MRCMQAGVGDESGKFTQGNSQSCIQIGPELRGLCRAMNLTTMFGYNTVTDNEHSDFLIATKAVRNGEHNERPGGWKVEPEG